LCPSDDAESILNTNGLVVADMYYDPNQTNYDYWNFRGDMRTSTLGAGGIGLTNYIGCGGVYATAPGSWGGLQLKQYKGIMLPTTKTEINTLTLEALANADGASNTLMFGELYDIGGGITWMASGSFPTFYPIPDTPEQHGPGEVWSSKHVG